MSELKYSKTGIPYIDLVDAEGRTYGNFIFSRTTSTKIGYKYVCFTHRFTNSVISKKGTGDKARRIFTDVDVNESYIFNFKLKRDADGKKGVPQGMMPTRLIEWVKALFSEFTVDGIIPFSAIKLIEPIIAEMDIDRILVTDSERVKKAKAKERQEKKEAKLAAEDKAELEEQIIRDDYKNTPRRDALEAEVVKKKIVPLSEVF